jgi:hypothetical protein
MSQLTRWITALLLLAATGCYVHSIRLDNAEYAHYDESRPSEVNAQECGVLVAFIPFSLKSHLIRTKRILESRAPDSVFTDVRVQQSWTWLLVGDMLCTKVSATAYPKIAAPALAPTQPPR